MKRYIKSAVAATDIVRDLYHRMPNELNFIDERNRPDGMIDLVFEVTSRFKHEAEDICKSLVGEGLAARMGRNNRIIITAPEDDEADVTASTEFVDMGTGLEYWYFTKHGVGPGSVPRGLNILEIRSVRNGDYFKTDRVLTKDALDYYEIKERSPYEK